MPRREVEKNEEVEEKQVRQAWQAAGPRRSRRPQGKGAVCLLLIVSINHFSRGSIDLAQVDLMRLGGDLEHFRM